MSRITFALLITVTLISTLLASQFFPQAHAQVLPSTPSPITLQSLTTDVMTWYNTNAGGVTAKDTDFGPYILHALGDSLYVGINRRIPTADMTGPILAKHDGTTLSKIAVLPEDSLFRIKSANNKIYSPGYDPNGSDGWDAGNFHIYDPATNTLTKKRYRYSNWQFVDATTTDANGSYSFSNLKNTSYRIRLVKPAGYSHSPQNAKGVGNYFDPTGDYYRSQFDSNFSAGGEMITCSNDYELGLNLSQAFTDTTIDGGLFASPGTPAAPIINAAKNPQFYGGSYSINSTIWDDTDADGRQDTGEVGLPGVRVEIFTRDPYFPCAIHMPAMWASDEEIIVNYGFIKPKIDEYSPNNFTGGSANATYRSVDQGQNWEFVGENAELYYGYDMAKFNNRLYKLNGGGYNDYDSEPWTDGYATRLTTSTNNGANWTTQILTNYFGQRIVWSGYTTPSKVYGMKFPAVSSIVEFQNSLVFPGSNGSEVIRFKADHTQDTIPVTGVNFKGILSSILDPDFKPLTGTNITKDEIGHLMNWDTFANAEDTYLYAIGSGKKIYVTQNLKDWVVAADFSTLATNSEPISIEYWPAKKWVVVGTTGSSSALYYFDHQQIAQWLNPPTPTPSPTPSPSVLPSPSISPSPQPTAPNLVANPSFEIDADANNKPDAWWPRPMTFLDKTKAKSGTTSMKVGGVTGSHYTFQTFTLKPNTTYTMRAWAINTAPKFGVQLRYPMYSSLTNYNVIPTTYWAEPSQDSWKMIQKVFTTPADTLTLSRLDINWWTPNGETFWIDDVELCEGDNSKFTSANACLRAQ